MTLGKLLRMGAAAGTLLVAFQANAADLGARSGGYKDGPMAYAVPTWTGFYVGINGGYGWRDTGDQFAYPAGVDYPAYDGIAAEGGFGGGQIGYNWQGFAGMPSIVTGIEADIQGSGISRTDVNTIAETYKTNLDWFGTVRGRVGFSAGNGLVYFTGGFAYGGLNLYAQDNTFAIYESDGTVTGYVLGGGTEYKINPSWSLKAEYQYLNFGKNDPAFASGDPTYPAASGDGYKITDDAYHTVRVGLNYWVNPAYERLK